MADPHPSLFDPADDGTAAFQERWTAVDAYLVDALVPDDPALDAALDASDAADLPAINVAPNQGRLLELLARAVRARRILEVGTLGGYSTIWLARALPADGDLVTLELNPAYAAVAQLNIDRAGAGDRVDIRIGPAADSLVALRREAESGGEPFDLVFIDADKQSSAVYLDHAVALCRPGALVVVDNTVRAGTVADARSVDERVRGIRAMHDAVAADPRLVATAIQTVGSKGWDGLTMALVLP